MAHSSDIEEDTNVLLGKQYESDSDIEAEYHSAKSERPRRLQWLNTAQLTAHWSCHLLLALLLILIFNESVFVCPPHLAEKVLVRSEEEGYADINRAVQYEIQNAEGRDEFGQNPDTSWKGRPTQQNLQKWSDVMQLGIVAITEAEQDALGLNTTRSPYSNELFIILQVYHDLHCLKIMRESFWSFVEGGTASWGLKLHFDHCIDALRQVVMCYADLSPIPKTPGAIDATRNINRQCRNWDAIENWAKSRNTTGLLIHAHPAFLPDPLHIS